MATVMKLALNPIWRLVAVLLLAICSSSAYGTQLTIYPLGTDEIEAYSDVERFSLDSTGVLVLLPTETTPWEQPIYHPTQISRFAMDNHAKWVETSEKVFLDVALDQTNWLAAKILEGCHHGLGLLKYEYPGSFGLEAGWASAMGQGLALGALALLSAHAKNKELYERGIDCGLKGFAVDVAEGGLRTAISTENAWYEEYPALQRPRVLNGHIFALSGLWLVAQNGNEQASALFKAGIGALKVDLEKYDAGFTSYYANSLVRTPLSPRRYNREHVDQLLWLWHITGDDLFFQYAAKFLAYQDKRVSRLARKLNNEEVELLPALNDKATFFGREGFEAGYLEFELLTPRPVCPTRLVIFGYGVDQSFARGVSFFSATPQNRFLVEMTPRPDLFTTNKTGVHETAVVVFDLLSCPVATTTFYVGFSSPNIVEANRYAFREIDLVYDAKPEAEQRYTNLRTINHWKQ